MNEKCILFFDIDGTLIDSNTHLIPATTKKALHLLRAQGHCLCIATGRSMNSVVDSNIHKLIDWDLFICNNGQAIYDQNRKAIHITPISSTAVYACIKKAEQMNSPLLIMSETAILTREANSYTLTSHQFFKERIPPVQPYLGTPVVMMMAYGPHDYDYKEYKSIEGIHVIPGQSLYADIVREDCNKAFGIEKIISMYPNRKRIAFGDSANDIEMLSYVDVGIAMGNAIAELQSIADRVTETVHNDGIYTALKTLGILE